MSAKNSFMDFGSMIGSPLIAVVNAQSQAAMATVDFIKKIGFRGEEPVTMPFRYQKAQIGEDGKATVQGFELSVPMLSLVPIPCIRIQETRINFNAKVVDVRSERSESEGEGTRGRGGRGGARQLQVSFANRQRSSHGSDQHRSYSMRVQIKAVQDDLPAGLERLLHRMEGGLLDRPLEEEPKK